MHLWNNSQNARKASAFKTSFFWGEALQSGITILTLYLLSDILKWGSILNRLKIFWPFCILIWKGLEYFSFCFLISDVYTCDALRDLVPYVQFQKRKKHPRRGATFGKVGGSACNFTKSNTLRWVFFTFFKLYKWPQIA